MKVRAGVMNAFGCAYEGRVPVTRVLQLVRTFMKKGPEEICLADSSGLANPLQMEEVLARVRHETADTDLSLHLHNTRGRGWRMSMRRSRRACRFRYVHGRDGRMPLHHRCAGNIATEDTVGMLHGMVLKTGIDLDALSRRAVASRSDGTDIPRSTHAPRNEEGRS